MAFTRSKDRRLPVVSAGSGRDDVRATRDAQARPRHAERRTARNCKGNVPERPPGLRKHNPALTPMAVRRCLTGLLDAHLGPRRKRIRAEHLLMFWGGETTRLVNLDPDIHNAFNVPQVSDAPTLADVVVEVYLHGSPPRETSGPSPPPHQSRSNRLMLRPRRLRDGEPRSVQEPFASAADYLLLSHANCGTRLPNWRSNDHRLALRSSRMTNVRRPMLLLPGSTLKAPPAVTRELMPQWSCALALTMNFCFLRCESCAGGRASRPRTL